MGSSSKGYGGKDGPPALTVRKPLVNRDTDWMDQGECLKPPYETDDFFPAMGDQKKVDRAKEICRVCPVFIECLGFALDNDFQYGIWGGTTPVERERMGEWT